MSVENSASHPTTGHILDTTPIEPQENPDQVAQAGDRERVIASFLHSADDHQFGLTGLLDQMRINGLGGHLTQWADGNLQPISEEDVQQAFGGDIIIGIATRAGVSAAVARSILSQVLPQLMQHVAPGGKPVAPQVSSLGAQVLQQLK